jgi:hypothetical protein
VQDNIGGVIAFQYFLKINLSFAVRREFSSTTVVIVAAEFARLITTGRLHHPL